MIFGRNEGRLARGLMTLLLVLVTMTIQRTSADLTSLIQMTARSLRERSERAALEPPTVTSLKPPNRSGSRGAAGLSVQAEQSGNYIPPIVASRSPSSGINSRDYKSRYTHIDTHHHQTSSPLATASSSSRAGKEDVHTERRSPSEPHVVVPHPAPHSVNGTTLSVPHKSSWVSPGSYAPPPPPPRGSYGSSGYAPIPRSYPRRPRIHEEAILSEPSYANGNPKGNNPYYSEEGVWGHTEDEPTGGIWGNSRRHPSYSQGHHRDYGHVVREDSRRTDTFGHRISEDLSHLSHEYPLHRSNSRTQIHRPMQSADVPDRSRESHPQRENIHIISQNPYHHRNRTPHLNVEHEESSIPHSQDSERTSSVRRIGMAPTAWGSSFDGNRTLKPKGHPRGEISPDESQGSHLEGARDSHHNNPEVIPPAPTSDDGDDPRRPLTLYEVWHLINMTTWEEFDEFLQRKGIKVGEILNYINEGATRQEVLDFLNKPDLEKRKPDYGLTETMETSNPSQTEKMDDVAHRHSASKARGERKNRRRGKKKGRKNRENGKRGKKDKKTTIPEIIFTTIIPSSDINMNGSMNQVTSQEPSDTVSLLISTTTETLIGKPLGLSTQGPNLSTPLLSTTPLLLQNSNESSTTPIIQLQMPTRGTLLEPTPTPQNTTTVQLTLNKTSTLEQQNLSLETVTDVYPTTTPISLTRATTRSPVLDPTTTKRMNIMAPAVTSPTILSPEFNPSTRATYPPTSIAPVAGSLTLPPTSNPSEVSIISFTVMKVTPEETFLEDITPIRNRQNDHPLHKKIRKHHTQRNSNQPRLLSSSMPNDIGDPMVIRTPYIREERKDTYTFPVKGFMIITGIMGALAVFTLVVLISYAIIKCSKQPVVNNYQVSEQKPSTQ